MILTDIQHFFLRVAGLALKIGFTNRSRIRLFHPAARLYFGNWLPVGAYKDIFVTDHYRCPVPLGDGARIIDGGANIGLSSLYFLQRYPTAQVDSYEANPPTVALLEKTLASANFAVGRYTVHGKALHTQTGQLPFYADPDVPSALNSSITGRDNLKERGARIDVPAIDIRSLLTTPIDLLKLDVEGHEYQLLDIAEIAPDTVRAMIIEFHEMDDHRDACESIFSRFRKAGYVIDCADLPELNLALPTSWTGTHIIRIFIPSPDG